MNQLFLDASFIIALEDSDDQNHEKAITLNEYLLTESAKYLNIRYMKTENKTYSFRNKILPDGHLYIPDEIGGIEGKEFEVTMTPTDDIKGSVSLYLTGRLEKKGQIRDINLDSVKIEKAVKAAFGTTDIDSIIQSVRR